MCAKQHIANFLLKVRPACATDDDHAARLLSPFVALLFPARCTRQIKPMMNSKHKSWLSIAP